MKKISAKFTALLVIFCLITTLFAACGKDENPSEDSPPNDGGEQTAAAVTGDGTPAAANDDNDDNTLPTDDDEEDDGDDDPPPADYVGEPSRAVAEFLALLESGTYGYDFTLTADDMEMLFTVAVDGVNIFMHQRGNYILDEYYSMTTILKDGILYVLDDVEKYFFVSEEMDLFVDVMAEAVDLTKIGGGSGEFDGRLLEYEDFVNADRSITIRFWHDGDTVCGMDGGMNDDGEAFVLPLSNITGNIPADIFEIPADYMDFYDFIGSGYEGINWDGL